MLLGNQSYCSQQKKFPQKYCKQCEWVTSFLFVRAVNINCNVTQFPVWVQLIENKYNGLIILCEVFCTKTLTIKIFELTLSFLHDNYTQQSDWGIKPVKQQHHWQQLRWRFQSLTSVAFISPPTHFSFALVRDAKFHICYVNFWNLAAFTICIHTFVNFISC